MATVDCCLNLRYPGAGETSGIAIRLMGVGKPVIVTDNAENSDFPRGAVLRVSARRCRIRRIVRPYMYW